MRYVTVVGLMLGGAIASAQSNSLFEKVDIHGAVSQGFAFSSGNNYLTMDTRNGSFRWTEGLINFATPLTEHLRVGIQLHSYSLGQIGQQKVSIDWAFGDYKVNNYFGIRVGKVKTPLGVFNDIQDIDALYPWVLLPQSIYPADLRSFHLSHTGFVAYGDIHLRKAGTLTWQGYAGSRSQDQDEGEILALKQEGTTLGDASGPTWGADVRWATPLPGFTLGASYLHTKLNAPGALQDGIPAPGQFKYITENFFAEYEKGRLRLDAEFNLEPSYERFGVPEYTYKPSRIYYFMGSWRFTDKITAGMYYSHDLGFDADNRDRNDPGNYSYDTVVNGRYEFNSHLYVKVEGHFIRGEANSFYEVNNPNGLVKDTQVGLARLGFVF